MRPHVEPLTCSSPLFSGTLGTSPAPSSIRALFLSFTRSISAILPFLCIRPCFSRQGSLNDRSDSLSAFVIMWLCRSSMRCRCRTTRTTSTVTVSHDVCRQNVNLLGSSSGILSTALLGKGGPAPPLSDVTFFDNFNSRATICHGAPHKPSQFAASHASFSVCLVQLLPRTTPFL